ACRAWRWRTGRAPAAIVRPLADRLSESLHRVRYFQDKQRFSAADATAQYLTSQIATDPAPRTGPPARGSFAWVQQEAGLDRVDAFVLALSLIATFDSAAGPVIAACHNDSNRASPTLGLAQKLWDRPEEILALA